MAALLIFFGVLLFWLAEDLAAHMMKTPFLSVAVKLIGSTCLIGFLAYLLMREGVRLPQHLAPLALITLGAALFCLGRTAPFFSKTRQQEIMVQTRFWAKVFASVFVLILAFYFLLLIFSLVASEHDLQLRMVLADLVRFAEDGLIEFLFAAIGFGVLSLPFTRYLYASLREENTDAN